MVSGCASPSLDPTIFFKNLKWKENVPKKSFNFQNKLQYNDELTDSQYKVFSKKD